MKNTSRILTGGAMLLFFLTLCLSVQSLLLAMLLPQQTGF